VVIDAGPSDLSGPTATWRRVDCERLSRSEARGNVTAMSEPALSPLTPREQAVARFFRRPRVTDASTVLIAGVLGLIARLLAQGYCTGGAPSNPEQYTEGGHYCATVSHGYSWLGYPAAAILLAGAVGWIFRRRGTSRRLALAVVTVAVIGASAWVYSLQTVPTA
jgi:hypothetical protein